MRWPALAPVIFVLSLLSPFGAAAKLCGDNVKGRDIPCSCGDVVVSDLVLDDDPVAKTVCEQDGLIVRAVGDANGVTVDLKGKTIRGGKHGAGIKILSGGAAGARIISSTGPAAIEGFEDGVFAHGAGSVALIDGVLAINNRRDGIRVMASGFEIRNSEVQGAGRDGFSLGGSGFRLSNTRAVGSKRSGYFVGGQNGTLGAPGAGPVAEGSGAFGFNMMGMGHQLVDCVSRAATKDGVMVMGMNLQIRGCVVSDNGGHGIGGMGGVDLAGNRALNNNRNGIYVTGPASRDGGGNSGSGNRGTGTTGPPIDCEIHHLPCFL
jgi:parallel beta helix pectate lyase-like protein